MAQKETSANTRVYLRTKEVDVPGRTAGERKYHLNYNDDAGGLSQCDPERPVETVHKWVDRVLNHISVDSFALSLALPDITFYPSNVGETLGKRFASADDIPDEHLREITRVIQALDALGTDPIAAMAERVHHHGAKFLAEMRMGDTHHASTDLSFALTPQFLVDHPQWVIRRSDRMVEGVHETAMDYSFSEVRAHRLAILRELAERPEIDGLDLNFIRWCKFFVREEAPDKAGIMTDFMGEVAAMLRAEAQKRGCDRLLLGVRIPSTLEECRWAGLDPQTWVQRGYLDYLVASDFNFSDPQMAVEKFAAFTRGTRCSLLAQMGDMIGGTWQGKPSVQDRGRGLGLVKDCYNGMRNTEAEARATAYNAYAWGGDGISFWNLCCNMNDHGKNSLGPRHRDRIFGWMNAVADPQQLKAGPRHYHFLPSFKWLKTPVRNYACNKQYHSPLGKRRCQILTWEQSGQRHAYCFRMADGCDREPLNGIMKFDIFHLAPGDDVVLDLNGAAISPEHVRREHRPHSDPPATRIHIDLRNCPSFQGLNELGIGLKFGGQPTSSPYMEELEVTVDQ